VTGRGVGARECVSGRFLGRRDENTPSQGVVTLTISASPLFASKAIDLCSDGDPICSAGHNPFAHTHYESSGYPAQAANFVAGLV
jgi:hypothetical protein